MFLYIWCRFCVYAHVEPVLLFAVFVTLLASRINRPNQGTDSRKSSKTCGNTNRYQKQ